MCKESKVSSYFFQNAADLCQGESEKGPFNITGTGPSMLCIAVFLGGKPARAFPTKFESGN